MPTGYTIDLYEGKEVTFEEFVMKCARAFGALISMKDEPLDAPIPERLNPSDYHLRELVIAWQRLAEVESWDEEQAEREAERAYQEAVYEHDKKIIEQASIRERYEEMLNRVRAWTPPTPEHEDLKRFMIEQLEKSIEFDCGHIPDEPKRLLGAEYKQQEIEKALHDIEYHKREYEDEIKRTHERNEWLKALRESLREEKTKNE